MADYKQGNYSGRIQRSFSKYNFRIWQVNWRNDDCFDGVGERGKYFYKFIFKCTYNDRYYRRRNG